MPFVPLPSMRGVVRLFVRELPRDNVDVAEELVCYAINHGIINAHEEPVLARQLAPRRLRRALRRVERDRAGRAAPRPPVIRARTAPEVADPAGAGSVAPRLDPFERR